MIVASMMKILKGSKLSKRCRNLKKIKLKMRCSLKKSKSFTNHYPLILHQLIPFYRHYISTYNHIVLAA